MRISDWSSDVCSSDLYTGFAGLQYERALSDGVTGFGRIDYSYRSGFWWDVLNTLREPNRHLLDASIGVRTGERKSVVEGTSVSVRVDLGGRRIIKKKTI